MRIFRRSSLRSFNTTKGRPFDSGILIVRNPFEQVLSHYNYKKTHSHTASVVEEQNGEFMALGKADTFFMKVRDCSFRCIHFTFGCLKSDDFFSGRFACRFHPTRGLLRLFSTVIFSPRTISKFATLIQFQLLTFSLRSSTVATLYSGGGRKKLFRSGKHTNSGHYI